MTAPPHILLVEDSAIVVDALRLLLVETGHRVSSASTVADAVSRATSDPPDLMLLDLSLGAEDGLEVLAALQQGSAAPITVAVTGHDDAHVRERCLTAGCRDVLVKPIAPLALPGQIRAWLATQVPHRGSAP